MIHGYSGAHGFTLVELAIALTVIGVLAWIATDTFGNLNPVADRATALAHGEELRSSMRAFALAHGRLPCPDREGDGLESLEQDACPPELETGWVPYVSLGMSQPIPELRAYYGVFRSTDSQADLARAIKRLPGGGPPGSGDLVRGLINADRLATDPDRIILTGSGGGDGNPDCVNNPVRNVAWFAVSPLTDRSGSGRRLDSVHDQPGFPSCAHAPSTPPGYNRDDVVTAETFSRLASWLQRHAATSI
ncbi:type II secretion system protein [Wenzhouxiangella sp. AB-CW3]|uniref:type II secretion system protein n=1 Tax=Wenzhouxiangella sp. AB-CW3 TaxID=2771012 RepID=UPI00168BB041|nr:type II secretion system protein [Wenzhouxiangella sp. AB-CW3]QOC22177.1 type II secretion system protein [Wenzhouxiangella sp. AB-CW3]